MNKEEIKITPNGIKQALDDLLEENEELKGILTDLEEWLKENIELKPLQTTYFFKCDGKQKSISEIELEELKRVDNKIQELKEKYK